MFNLLTVLIAVALTAIMGAAGVFYGGSAFTTAGPKAAALGITQSASQVTAAWTLYTNDAKTTTFNGAGNTPTLTNTGNTATDLISGGYLSALPTAPTNAVGWGGGNAGYLLDLTDKATNSGITGGAAPHGGVFLVLPSTAGTQCLEIARAGGQATSTGTLAAPGTSIASLIVATRADFNTAFANVKFGCAQLTNAAALTLNNVAGIAADDNKHIAYFKY